MVEVMARRSYVARFERDENGYWSVSAELGGKRTAVSDGQTLPKARRRIRQAISLLLDISEASFDVVEDIVLPPSVRRAVRTYEAVQHAAEDKARELQRARREAAKALESHGLSRRDAGEILGVTGQRVHQLLTGTR
jgi:predicted RNase H-like HicB family nuclease